MSVWHNVIWETPEEGKIYDVWVETGKRVTDCVLCGGTWIGYDAEHGWYEMFVKVTHFMELPEPPNN